MSLMIITKLPARAVDLEAVGRDNGDMLKAIAEDGRSKGADAGMAGPPSSTTHRILDLPDRF